MSEHRESELVTTSSGCWIVGLLGCWIVESNEENVLIKPPDNEEDRTCELVQCKSNEDENVLIKPSDNEESNEKSNNQPQLFPH